MKISTRTGEERDIETLVSFLLNLFAIEKDFTGDEAKHAAGLRLLLSNPHNSIVFVAEADGTLVGMVTAQLVVSTVTGGHSVLLEDLYVESDFRRKGVGSRLLERVVSWGLEHGARRVQLVAATRNRAALLLYRKAGLLASRMTALYGKIDTLKSHSD